MPMATHDSNIPSASDTANERPRYLEQRAPIVFPESAEVPETQLHLDLRTLLYQLLQDTLGEAATVGSDQFVYFDAQDPSACLAPDVYVGLMPAADKVRSWKVWERGAPAVAVEIVSHSDAPELPWRQKLTRYQRLGVRELVRFDPLAEDNALRVWDRVQEALTEREVTGERTRSLVLNVQWVVAPAEGMARALRVERDGQLVATRLEARQQEREAREQERDAAERRIRELEAELRKR